MCWTIVLKKIQIPDSDMELCLLNQICHTNQDKFKYKSIHHGKKTNEIDKHLMFFYEDSLQIIWSTKLKGRKYKPKASKIKFNTGKRSKEKIVYRN